MAKVRDAIADACHEAHIAVLQKQSDKKLAQLALRARREVIRAEKIIQRHRAQIKSVQASLNITRAFLENVTRARLEKELPRVKKGVRDLEAAKKVSPELLDSKITI